MCLFVLRFVFLLVTRAIVHKGGQESERFDATALIN